MPTNPDLFAGRVPVPPFDGSSAAAPTPDQATSATIEMRDGVRLAAHLYLPRLADSQPVPTVLSRLPYDKAGRYTFWDKLADRFTAHGFAVVVQDVRGKFESEGEVFPFRNEPKDGYDTLDWIEQQPWSNGRVGMFGDSYYGFTQWAAASTNHPALKAIVPRVTSSNFFLYAHPDWMPRMAMREWLVLTFSHPYLSHEPYASCAPSPAYRLPDDSRHIEQVLTSFERAIVDGSLQHELFPDGWPAERLTIPALHMSGWWDNCLEAQLVEWERATRSPAAAHQYLRISSTDHEAFPWRELGVPLADHENDDDATTAFLDHELVEPLAFLDHYLNDRGGRWNAPTVRFTTTNGHAQQADRWPPADVHSVELRLDGFEACRYDRGRISGLTNEPAEVVPASVSWVHDPRRPVPFLPQSEFAQCADLPDESYLHARDDILVFDSAPVGTRVDLCGPVRLAGTIAASTESTHVVARLLDLYPTGEARVICYGADVITTSGGPALFDVPMVATAYRLRPGHSLRLTLATSCFPLYAVHPGHDGDVWDLHHSAPSDQTLSTSREHPAALFVTLRGNHLAPPLRSPRPG